MTIQYKATHFKELTGDFKAEIVEVQVTPNNFSDDGKSKNYCKDMLSIVFQLEDPETLEAIMHNEKFVSPLTEGKGLFQQLLDAIEFLPDMDGGEFDEQSLVGVPLVVTMGKNKRNYRAVVAVKKGDVKTPVKPRLVVAEVKEEEDLPF